ncbi:MAG: hypothetical protein U0175_12785 [Caldilineaceae bacterium]
MTATKITLVGAGSTSFGVSMLLDIIANAADLAGSTITLADLNAESLQLMEGVANRLKQASSAQLTFEASTDLRAALKGANFVITSVAVDRLATWQKDWEIPLRYGFKQVLGENGGPGGLSHTLRSVHLMLQVARTVEEIAPDAWLLNFTNPLTRVCLALNRATKLKTVGLCHQIGAAYRNVGIVMGIVKDLDEAKAKINMLQDRFDVKAAGLNHITWIYDLRDNETGADIYPEFKRRLAAMPTSFEPLSRRLLDAFGLFPATGDGHAGEYFSYAWETSAMKGYDFEGRKRDAGALREQLQKAASGELPVEPYLSRTSGERAIQIITGMLHNRNQFEHALNLPNRGAIPGLPDWAVVETPGVISGDGIDNLHVPALPPAITSMLAQQVAIQDRAVEAAIHGDRQAALQALLLDPVVGSYENAVRMLDELLGLHGKYVNQNFQS